MKFSQRMGYTPVNETIQIEDMSQALRNSLWNILHLQLFGNHAFRITTARPNSPTTKLDFLLKLIWMNYFKQPIDELPLQTDLSVSQVRQYFFSSHWSLVYDFLEYIVENVNDGDLTAVLNKVLERELSGYRIIDNTCCPVTDQSEIDEIESAINKGPFSGARAHLSKALELLSKRERPDYRNSIKESISAVESAARELTKKPNASLTDALTILEKNGALHGAFKRGLTNLYGYTSDEGGIRHAMLEEPSLSAADAKFFLVICASFVNYLKSKIGN